MWMSIKLLFAHFFHYPYIDQIKVTVKLHHQINMKKRKRKVDFELNWKRPWIPTLLNKSWAKKTRKNWMKWLTFREKVHFRLLQPEKPKQSKWKSESIRALIQSPYAWESMCEFDGILNERQSANYVIWYGGDFNISACKWYHSTVITVATNANRTPSTTATFIICPTITSITTTKNKPFKCLWPKKILLLWWHHTPHEIRAIEQ